MKVPRVLIIAGSDSGGGAGIQADIKTVTMLGGHAMTAITAITAQNTLGVTAVMPVPTDMVLAQMDAVISDIGVDAVKIGMIGSAETAQAVAERLEQLDVPIVFDPVMVATSGSVLADNTTIAAFERLLRICTVATPNADELAALARMEVTGPERRDEAVKRVMDGTGCKALLAKGGDAAWTKSDDLIEDCLFYGENEEVRWTSTRIGTRHDHGTGCTLASAIAIGLGRGLELPEAVAQARGYVRTAMLAAPAFGAGHGPMGHWGAASGLLNMNQVTLPARDYGEAVAFYRMLGLVQIVDSPSNGYARFECPGGATLSIHLEPDPTPGGTVVYFEHGRLDQWVLELEGAGLFVEQKPRDESWGWREARLADPTGNRLCLYQAGEMRRFPPWRLSTAK
jgi:hydroxymethylpyrimidine/phosphomethylpyrimidine kinase